MRGYTLEKKSGAVTPGKERLLEGYQRKEGSKESAIGRGEKKTEKKRLTIKAHHRDQAGRKGARQGLFGGRESLGRRPVPDGEKKPAAQLWERRDGKPRMGGEATKKSLRCVGRQVEAKKAGYQPNARSQDAAWYMGGDDKVKKEPFGE